MQKNEPERYKQLSINLEETRKEQEAKIEQLKIQLEESTKYTSVDTVEVEKYKIVNEELQIENKQLKQNNEIVKKTFVEIESLKKELLITKNQLKHHHPPTFNSNNNDIELKHLKDSLEKEKQDHSRLKYENIRLMEKIRMMNSRKSISETESQININKLQLLTVSGVLRTAFVNGSRAKKMISFYILFLHIIIVYKLFY